MSDALMDLHAHYKAVRARLNAGPPPKPPEPVTPPPPPPPPLTVMAAELKPAVLLHGLKCISEVRHKILPVLQRHRMNWAEASGKSQKWKHTECRFEIYAVLNAHGWSLSQIGRLCGDRDHTTVLSGINRFIKKNMTQVQLDLCKDLNMRPVVYCVEWVRMREARND